jgi:hypothetical protein
VGFKKPGRNLEEVIQGKGKKRERPGSQSEGDCQTQREGKEKTVHNENSIKKIFPQII